MGVNIKLAEKPFYGFQGEGPTQGKNSLFIRFKGCNLSCSLCDSKYAKDGSSEYEIAENDLTRMMQNSGNVIFTGGEPLLHIPKLKNLLLYTDRYGTSIEVETNGTLETDLYDFCRRGVQFNISPKGNIELDKPVNTEPYMLKKIRGYDNYCVKFLLEKDSDIEYVKEVRSTYNIPNDKIYIQPVGIDRETIYKTVEKYYNIIIKNSWNLSTRLHVLFFNNKRGV